MCIASAFRTSCLQVATSKSKMAEGGSDLELQRNEISNLLKQSLKKGEVRYLIDSRWFKQWKKYVGYDSWPSTGVGEQSSHPGPIDNSPLFKDNTNEVREYLVEQLDFEFVPKEAYEMLSSWYGVMESQEPIVRSVIENGTYVKLCHVEIYLLDLRLCLNNDLDNFVTHKFSKGDTIEHLENVMRKSFDVSPDKETRLWSRYASYTFEQLTKKDISISDASLFGNQLIVIEVKDEDGSWPRNDSSTNNSLSLGSSSSTSDNKTYGGSSSAMSSRYTYIYNYTAGTCGDSKPGLCGLSNLGNTCFMNSALQCMSNTPPITSYFLQDRYFDELNTENCLGMKGEIAKAFGELVKIMWSGNYTCTYPRNFKMQVGRFAPQFSGYQQQDSQELMAFLLDGLHEDLNRIKKKPYIELKDTEGRPDEIVAKEAWDNYRKRNDSIIVDIFHGLLKSTLVCPECTKVSVTFDPFCYLTLPLPIKKERHIEVFFIPQDPDSVTVQYKLTVPKAGCIQDLCVALGQFTDVSPSKMVVTDVFNHKFHKIFQPDEGLNGIMDRDCIFIYEIPCSPKDDSDMIVLPVYMRHKHVWSGCSRESRANYHIFGQPLVVCVPAKTCTYELLYQAVLLRMKRYVRIPSPDETWWSKPGDERTAVNGEVEMLNGDEAGDESDSPADEDNKEEDEGIDSQEECETVAPGPGITAEPHSAGKYMFSMHFVNSSGTTDVSRVKDDGSPIKFTYQPYLAINWLPKAKKLFYDEKKSDTLVAHESASSMVRPSIKKQVIQVNECLELFTATERLSAEDSWYCPSCKKHQQATKKFDLWSLPQVLVLCFKRFSYSRYMRDKLDALVEFPIRDLNMSKYIINQNHQPAVYDLIAVSNHYGGMGGGHYTALAKNKDDQKWYNFDDGSVSSVKEDAVVTKAAYVLFYMLRDGRNTNSTPTIPREIPAAQGTPGTPDNSGISENSDEEDFSMETN